MVMSWLSKSVWGDVRRGEGEKSPVLAGELTQLHNGISIAHDYIPIEYLSKS